MDKFLEEHRLPGTQEERKDLNDSILIKLGFLAILKSHQKEKQTNKNYSRGSSGFISEF